VTGPDEYSAVVDNNAYTNLMARENLSAAAEGLELLHRTDPDSYDRLVTRLHIEPDEPAEWCRAAERMFVPYDERSGVLLQDEHFLNRKPWDFQHTPVDNYPLLLHYHPLNIYRHQVIKQTDVVLATFLAGDRFTLDEKRRVFEYYDPLTTGDSSLSSCVQSVMAAEVGDLQAAYDYFLLSAAVDLANLAGNVSDGIHVASCGGSGWRSSTASPGCATATAAICASALACPPTGRACASGSSAGVAAWRSRCAPTRRPSGCSTAPPCRSSATGSASRSPRMSR